MSQQLLSGVTMTLLLHATLLLALWQSCDAFQSTVPRRSRSAAFVSSLFCVTVDPSCVSMVESEFDLSAMQAAASFMVDSFWLSSPQQLVLTGPEDGSVTVESRKSLVEIQAEDLMDKFGERLGKRMLDASLITALDDKTDEMVGIVGVEVRLLDKSDGSIWGPVASSDTIKNAVASLGPKQRRQYKDATVQVIAAELLPPELETIALLSNLSVSPKARRQGLAQRLCEKVELVARSWGYSELYLKVEAENEAARALYEQKMRFREAGIMKDAPAIRVDAKQGEFVEIPADTLVLSKSIRPSSARQAAL